MMGNARRTRQRTAETLPVSIDDLWEAALVVAGISPEERCITPLVVDRLADALAATGRTREAVTAIVFRTMALAALHDDPRMAPYLLPSDEEGCVFVAHAAVEAAASCPFQGGKIFFDADAFFAAALRNTTPGGAS